MRGAVPLIGLALAAAPLAAQNECSGLFDPALRPGCELAVDAYHTAQRVGGQLATRTQRGVEQAGALVLRGERRGGQRETDRSEERRVGKEGRSRGSPYH